MINSIKLANLIYSYVSNKRACAFILFGTFIQPCTALLEPARLLILEVTFLPARLLKPAPFWILLYSFNKKCRNCYQIVATTQVQKPRTNFDKKFLINLIFSAYLFEIHLPSLLFGTFSPCTFIEICNPTLLFKPALISKT